MHVCYTSQAIFATGSVDSFTIYHTQVSRYVGNSFARLCSTHVLTLCSETAGMFMTVARDHLAHRIQLHSISMHFCKSCKHICSCGAEPAGISVTLASDPQSKIVNEYDQEIPQSQTADNPVAPRGRAAQPSRDTRKTN